MPAFLSQRPDAVAVVLAMLGDKGFDLLAAGLWSQSLTKNQIERLQRVALLHGTTHDRGRKWVTAQFTSSMPNCRATLAELIIPGIRLPDHPYGGLFAHGLLVSMSVQVRDTFWSTPDFLPANHDAPWEGFADPLDALLILDSCDEWTGMPLLAAWATTTCNEKLRRVLRERIALWGADKPAQLRLLLDAVLASNDPQMLEDAAWAVYGAVSLASEPQASEWSAVRTWFVDAAEVLHSKSPWNIEITHVGRAITAYLDQNAEWPPLVGDASSSLLPLDPVAASADGNEWRIGALDRNLIWYVVPAAYRPFFDDVGRSHNRRNERRTDGLAAVPGALLNELVEGRIRPAASDDARALARAELERRGAEERQREARRRAEDERFRRLERWYASLSSEKRQALLQEHPEYAELFRNLDELVASTRRSGAEEPPHGDGAVGSDHSEHIGGDTDSEHTEHFGGDASAEQTEHIGEDAGANQTEHVDVAEQASAETAEAASAEPAQETRGDAGSELGGESVAANAKQSQEDLLARHAVTNGLQSLTPAQLANGYCQHRVLELGWDASIHYKDPRGEKPGEVLGLDVAILRQYGEAGHGERSTICKMAEKYCWIARHELVGYLARLLPAACGDELVAAPVESAHFVETVNPATDHLLPYSTQEWPLDPFAALATPHPVAERPVQRDMANEWVEASPVPDIRKLLSIRPECLPVSMRPYEWLVLQAFATREDADTMGTCTLWASAFAVTTNQLSILKTDVAGGHIERLEEFHAGVEKVEFYSDPSELVWAPWCREAYEFRTYDTLDEAGTPAILTLRALSANYHWRSQEGEQQLRKPTRWISEALGISRLQKGEFRRADQVVAALLQDPAVLLARADLLRAALAQAGLTLCWGVRLFREPNTVLYSEENRFARWDWYGLGIDIPSSSTIEMQLTSTGLEPDHFASTDSSR